MIYGYGSGYMKWRRIMARSIASRIAELLAQQKLTQKELAQRSGITEAAISRYVKGDRVPRGVNLAKIADALGTSTDYLLGHDTFEDDEKKLVKTLIARNASKMTSEERMELLRILLDNN